LIAFTFKSHLKKRLMSRKIKVLHLGKFYFPYRGGVERSVKDICDTISGEVDVKVLVANTTYKNQTDIVNGIEVRRVASWGLVARTSFIPTLPIELSSYQDYDILHCHCPNPVAELSYLISKIPSRAKLVVSWHHDVIKQKNLLKIYRPFQQLFLERADAILVASPQMLENSLQLRPFRDKCKIIPYFIDPTRLTITDEKVATVRREIGGKKMILSVGRLVKYKGFVYLIEAMSKLKAMGITNVQLIIVGTGPLKSYLRGVIKRYGLQNMVTIRTNMNDTDLIAHFAACDIFVLPSAMSTEAFGIVQLEAMNFAKPLICTKLGTGTEYVNVANETGLVVEPCNADALATSLKLLIENDALRQTFGNNGRKRLNQLFSKDKVISDILDIYKDLVAD
jgi:glycosyltransferase involved in cell wall biosynthesis